MSAVVPEDWIAHRRPSDRELVGWIRPAGDGWIAVSLLGHDVSGAVDWPDAERALDERGLAWLADVWWLDTGDASVRVRIIEVTPRGIAVQTDDFGAIDAPVERFDLAWPAPPTLRPLTT